MLEAGDGVRLRYSVLLPEGSGPFPVLVRYSGYDSGSIGGATYLEDNETFSVALDKFLLEHGYAIMGVQARGTGCSEGVFDFLGPDYGTDGRDAVEFAARQPWSTGNIGMFGWSWAGMSQLMSAAQRPQGLKAIAPGMVLGDARSDSWAPGGVPAPEFVSGWHWFLDQRHAAVRTSARSEGDQACLARLDENQVNIRTHSLMYQLLRHPLRDDWVKQRSPRDRTHLIEVPVLSMSTWQDEAVMAREGYYQHTLNPDKLWLVQSNGPHDLYESVHFRPILLAFFDRFVKGIENGFERRAHVEIWQETTSKGHADPHDDMEQATPGWVIKRARFPLDIHPVIFTLAGNGRLLDGAADAEGGDTYQYPVPGPDVNTYENPDAWGTLNPGWRNGALAYTSAPLLRDLLSYGPASVDLWLSTSTGPDFDVQVTLTHILPDGQEMYVQRGWLRMSARKLDEEKSTPLLPWRVDTPDSVQPVYPDEPVLGRVELPPFSHPFRKGSRIRIWIDAPGRTGGNGFDVFALPARITLLHNIEYPSRLVLGELRDLDIPSASAACGQILSQPCRPDPLRQPE